MQAWDAFLRDLEQTMGKEVVEKWLRPLKVSDFDACNLYLEAESSFQVAWFDEHIRKLAQEKLCNNNAHPIKIHFLHQKEGKKKKEKEVAAPLIEIGPDGLDSSSTFSNFLFGEQNALIVDLFKKTTFEGFNPIFLYGAAGVGKTHLLMACAQKLREQNLSVFYVHAESFTEHVVKAIRSSQMDTFRKIYRNQDVLIVDDVHHFARKGATQEEFFHTFNALHTKGKQILLSSSHPPSQLEDIEPRLISRFEWGILLKLQPLPLVEMAKVLQNRARLHHFSLSDPVCAFLINTYTTSTKSMMRALEALMLRHRGQTTLSLQEAEILLRDLTATEQKLQLTPDKIVDAVASYFGICSSDILGKSQSKECTLPRKIAMYLCRQKLEMSYLAIGRFFLRDHSTVMASIKQVDQDSAEMDFLDKLLPLF